MRLLLAAPLLLLAACAPANEAEVPLLPTGAVRLEFRELNDELCGPQQSRCGSASRPLVAGASTAQFSAEGTRVSLELLFWQLTLQCDFIGCFDVWVKQPRTVCYALEGNAVAPATDCEAAPPLVSGLTLPQAGPMDGFSVDHSQRRALLGLGNGDAPLRLGTGAALGAHWLGDLSAVLARPTAWSDLAFRDEAAATRTLTALTSGNGATLELLLPPPDGVKLSEGLRPTREGLLWVNQADDVFTLSVDESLEVKARRLRTAITTPRVRTAGAREVGSEVLSALLTTSTTTLSGIGAAEVLEVSLLRTPKRDEPARPLWAFAPFTAHAAGHETVVVCFPQPLDAASLVAGSFSIAGVEVRAVAPSGVPQCARLDTAPLPRNGTLEVAVHEVRNRSGASASGSRIALVTPDDAPVPGVLAFAPPAGTRASLPTSDGRLLISSGPELGVVDLGGVVVERLASGTPRTEGAFVTARPDAQLGGFWAAWGVAGGQQVLARQTATGSVESPAGDLNPSGLLEPAGDGTALVATLAGPLARLHPDGTREALPRATALAWRGPLGSGKVLLEEAGRLQVVTLPDTSEGAGYALPAGVGAQAWGPARASGGEVYWCVQGRLYRLGDTASTNVRGCTRLVSDERGVLWVTDTSVTPATLTRVEGLTLREVVVPHPFDAARRLTEPTFGGGFAWADGGRLRLEVATWRALAGETP